MKTKMKMSKTSYEKSPMDKAMDVKMMKKMPMPKMASMGKKMMKKAGRGR